jgi:hypothetical protein
MILFTRFDHEVFLAPISFSSIHFFPDFWSAPPPNFLRISDLVLLADLNIHLNLHFGSIVPGLNLSPADHSTHHQLQQTHEVALQLELFG